MKKAVAYIRVSTTEQAEEGYSLEAQEQAIRQYAAARGYEITRVYADEGVSAKDITHRKYLTALLEDAAKKEFEAVLIWKLTRFTRSVRDLENSCAALDQYGISLISITETFDTASASGRLMRRMLGVIGEFEREVISENVKLGMTARAHKGLPTCPYALGYDLVKGAGKMIINPAEAEIVRTIFQGYAVTGIYLEVARQCNARGWRGKHGHPFSAESIRKILKCPMYIGYFTWRGSRIRGADLEPIIAPGLWEAAQNKRANAR